MQKKSSQVFNEIIWLTISFVVTLVLSFFIIGRHFLDDTIDIHLHDTYFVIAPFHIFLSVFFMLTFIIFYIKGFRDSFRRVPANWILLICGLTLVISLTFLIKTFSQLFIGGVTLYPPLSALGPDKIPELTQDPTAKFIISFLRVMQIVILLMLLFYVYRWGRQKEREG